MIYEACVLCRAALNGLSGEKQQAERIDKYLPHCGCEAFSVGTNSPGIVKSGEYLYRMIITPGDIDTSGKLLLNALRDVREDGLSVFRECATDEDISALVIDRLTLKPSQTVPKTVHALLRVETNVIRRMREASFGRFFCVYDETVPRRMPDLPAVPTHATVLQRLFPAGTDNRNGLNKQITKNLHDRLSDLVIELATFRDGLLASLNERSLAGEFKMQETG